MYMPKKKILKEINPEKKKKRKKESSWFLGKSTITLQICWGNFVCFSYYKDKLQPRLHSNHPHPSNQINELLPNCEDRLCFLLI